MVEPVLAPNERLLRAIVEQLKLPLLQIARQTELAMMQGKEVSPAVNDIATMAMQLVDGFLLSQELHGQESLQLEPVSVSSVMYDTAHALDRIAQQYDYTLEVSLGGKYGPVMAHHASLMAALTTLGYSFIETAGQQAVRRPLVLGAHRSGQGLVTGLFISDSSLSADMFRRARALYGTSRQPLQTTHASAGAGVFVADSLFNVMAAQLRVARHHKLTGLAATLLPSQQMQLV